MLADVKSIDIVAEPREQITVNLVGKPYLITPPKGALALGISKRVKTLNEEGRGDEVWGEVENWLRSAVGAKQFTAIQKRLDDANDDLDIKHIVALMTKVVEAVTETPTSS